ncbi:MAG: methyltransferase [Lentisphaerae bacterium]|nr:methyltransferase [Lentisphaerota bacterium]
MPNEVLLNMIMRLAMAGFLGTLIGLEREYRAKDAGMRTHFLVALGSALIMIVSQYGFGEGGDPSRVAAQIVSGIGFIGAGTIMMHKQFVRGLTTAAGLWVAAGIGMAIGGGMYLIGIVTTVFTLIGLEFFQILFQRFHSKNTQLVFTTRRHSDLVRITEKLNESGCKIMNCSVTSCAEGKHDRIRVKMLLFGHSHNSDETSLVKLLEEFSSVSIEKIE